MFKKCIHNRKLYECNHCGGIGIFPHNRDKSRCRACNGFWYHSRRRAGCPPCFKTLYKYSDNKQQTKCIHGKINCKECILANSKELKILSIIRELNKNTIMNDLDKSINIIKNIYNVCEHNNIKTNCYQCQNNFIKSLLN